MRRRTVGMCAVQRRPADRSEKVGAAPAIAFPHADRGAVCYSDGPEIATVFFSRNLELGSSDSDPLPPLRDAVFPTLSIDHPNVIPRFCPRQHPS